MGCQGRAGGVQITRKTCRVTAIESIVYVRYLNRFSRLLWLAQNRAVLILSQWPFQLPAHAETQHEACCAAGNFGGASSRSLRSHLDGAKHRGKTSAGHCRSYI